MGSVKQLTTTGDNDDSLMHQKYFRHYLYCDLCGSFAMKAWIEPKNHVFLEKAKKQLDWISNILFYGFAYSLIITFIWAFIYFMMTGAIEIQGLMVVIAGLMFLGFLIFYGFAQWVRSKIYQVGVKCTNCSAQYNFGTPFFLDLESNPKNFSMSDVPRPLNTTYWIKGETESEND